MKIKLTPLGEFLRDLLRLAAVLVAYLLICSVAIALVMAAVWTVFPLFHR